MNEKLKDTTIDLLLDGVKTKIEDVKENYKWQELFVSTGSFCVNNPDTLTMFEQDLFLVFSKDNLKQMAKKLKDKRGYEFPQLLHRELYDLMVRYEIPAMEAETYIHHFIQVIINYLEENDPDKTLEIFLGDLKKEIEKYFFALESKLELVLNQIADLKEEKVLSYSITDIDIQIRRESKYKGMGLDFFKLDDEQFESRFQSVINDERIYVVGKSREETTYRLLNELRQKNSDRVTLIIKSEEEWNKLQKANVSGNILVPFFYAEKIVAIPNNTNIFVYGEDEPCYTRDKVVLRKRTKRNIINALEEISNIFVKSLHSDQNIKQIQITDFQVGMDGICKLLYYNKGIKIKEYLLNISKMNYSNYSSVISLELNDISLVDEGYIAYSAAGHGFGNEYPRVYFSSGEKIIIKRKENL